MKREEIFNKGHKFGEIEFIEEAGYSTDPKTGKRRRLAKFKCYCGNEFITKLSVVKRHIIKSCGCYTIKKTKEVNTKHGLVKHPLYCTWVNIKNRCLNRTKKQYDNYGGRGITVCNEWKENFTIFYDWCIKNNWRWGLTVDRIDVNGNYCPENCKLSTDKEQSRNKRNTIYVDYMGNSIPLIDYCELLGVDYSTVRNRIKKYNWSLEKAVNTERRIDKISRLYKYEPEYSI